MAEKTNYYENFLNLIRELAKGEGVGIKLTSEFEIFIRFIQIMGEKHFNTAIGWYVNDTEPPKMYNNFDDWYYMFHKSMRNTDFFDFETEGIGGHLDMIFWNFCHISEVPYKVFKRFFENDFKASVLTLNWNENE